MVKKRDIITIVDLKSASNSQIGRDLIKNLEKKRRNHHIAPKGKEKSLIVTDDAYYYSPISSITLLGRSEGRTNWLKFFL